MKKQYGIFQIDDNQLIFLSDRYLHDTEEEAINWFPRKDAHYVIMPVYVTTEQNEFNYEWNNKIKTAEELRTAFIRYKQP